jgi:hypothetical protein
MVSSISQNSGTISFRQEGDDIQYSLNGSTSSWTNVTDTEFPINIINNTTISEVLTVKFTTDMEFTKPEHYFKCGSQYITFDGLKDDGNRATITFKDVTDCLGLIQNGNIGTNGYSNITVQNIHVASIGATTLSRASGWVCQAQFGRGSGSSDVLIDNCSSDGNIAGTGAGGICGTNSGPVTISNCYSTGQISGNIAGGICGAGAGLNGTVEISNCYSTGQISGNGAGGICGAGAGTVEISNCYSTGQISGNGAGGICGGNAGHNGFVTISNSYSLGQISGQESGGICGMNAGTRTRAVTITNCYSLYANGDTSVGSGGMVGSGYATFSETYGANGNWVSADANQQLTGTPTVNNNPGETWGYHVVNAPYYLTVNPTTPPPTFEEMIESGELFEDIIAIYTSKTASASRIETIEYVLSHSYWDTIEITGDITGMNQHTLTNRVGQTITIIAIKLVKLII